MDPAHLTVLYEDNHLLTVVKPAGVLVQGDRSGEETLLDGVRAYLRIKYAKPGNIFLGLVHRLDRRVSGVVVLARTSKAASRLSRQFREGTVVKRYLAVVEGHPTESTASLRHHLSVRGDRRGVTRADIAPFEESRPAELRYTVEAAGRDRSLLAVRLITGRRHQIRAQLALAGVPVWGDVKYGARRQPASSGIGLLAARIEIAHPVSGEQLIFEAPEPKDWPWPRNKEKP